MRLHSAALVALSALVLAAVAVRGQAPQQANQATVIQGATVISAAGKFILPGLWDSHAHTRDYDGDLNINHGVTSTMDMGNLMDWMSAVQEAREKQLWT